VSWRNVPEQPRCSVWSVGDGRLDERGAFYLDLDSFLTTLPTLYHPKDRIQDSGFILDPLPYILNAEAN